MRRVCAWNGLGRIADFGYNPGAAHVAIAIGPFGAPKIGESTQGVSGMRPSRKFRPRALDALEDRVALSHVGPLGAASTGVTYDRFTTTYYDGTTQVDTR